MNAKKTTKKQHDPLTSALIECLSTHRKELRKLLTEAKQTQVWKKNFENFDEYLVYVIKISKTDISKDYARKQANAGIVEIKLFGRENIGTMKEGALRIFCENVDECNWEPVYLHAKKSSKNKYPTGTQIKASAKKLKVYHQEKSDKPVNTEHNKTNPKTVNMSRKVNGKATNTDKRNEANVSASQSKKPTSNVVSVNSKSSEQAFKYIMERCSSGDIKSVLGFFRVHQDEKKLVICDAVLAKCTEVGVRKLVEKLSNQLKSVGTGSKAGGIKKTG